MKKPDNKPVRKVGKTTGTKRLTASEAASEALLIYRETFATVADALAAAMAQFADVLTVWESAVRSAQESPFATPAKVFRALQAIAEVGRGSSA